MARLIRLEAADPIEVKPNENGRSTWICTCGLSKNYPLCDGAHAATRREEAGKLYVYNSERTEVVEVKDDQ